MPGDNRDHGCVMLCHREEEANTGRQSALACLARRFRGLQQFAVSVLTSILEEPYAKVFNFWEVVA